MQHEYNKYKDNIVKRLQDLEDTSRWNIGLGIPSSVSLDIKATQPVNNGRQACPSNLVVLIRHQESKIWAAEHIINGIDILEQAQLNHITSYGYALKILGGVASRPILQRRWREFPQHRRADSRHVNLSRWMRRKTRVWLSFSLKCFPGHLLAACDYGSYAQWLSFLDVFRQMIQEQQLGSAQKMWCFKSNLKDEPERRAETVHHRRKLWRSMEDDDISLQQHWIGVSLSYQQPMSTTESFSALKKLHDVTKKCLSGLKTFQINIDS